MRASQPLLLQLLTFQLRRAESKHWTSRRVRLICSGRQTIETNFPVTPTRPIQKHGVHSLLLDPRHYELGIYHSEPCRTTSGALPGATSLIPEPLAASGR